VKRKHSLVDIKITLAENQVAKVLSSRTLEGGQRKFLLPVCLSTDLRLALAFYTIIEVLPGRRDRTGDNLENVEKYSIHSLDMHMLPEQPMRLDVQFSPDAQYLAVCYTLTRSGEFWRGELLIWHDLSQENHECDFRWYGKAVTNNFTSSEGRLDKNFAFHPHFPFLVFGGQVKTRIWHLQHERESSCKHRSR
jgi:hypothetical protein